MTVEGSKHRCFLTLTFIVKSVSKNLLIQNICNVPMEKQSLNWDFRSLPGRPHGSYLVLVLQLALPSSLVHAAFFMACLAFKLLKYSDTTKLPSKLQLRQKRNINVQLFFSHLCCLCILNNNKCCKKAVSVEKTH